MGWLSSWRCIHVVVLQTSLLDYDILLSVIILKFQQNEGVGSFDFFCFVKSSDAVDDHLRNVDTCVQKREKG